MTYHYQLMHKARITLAFAAGLVLFDVFILPKIAFYSFQSWLVGIAFVLGTIIFLSANAHIFPHNGLMWEWAWRKTFKEVCAKQNIKISEHCPKYRRIIAVYKDTVNLASLRFEIYGITDINESRWKALAPVFATEFHVVHFDVKAEGDRVIFQSLAKTPKQQAQDELGIIQERLRVVDVGIRPDSGEHFEIPLLGTHTLIAGKTGAGKGSWIWSILLATNELRRLGYVQWFGIDPKLLELGLGRSLFTAYASDDEAIVLMLEKLVEQMQARGGRWQGKGRKVTISRDDPLRIIVIDELLYVAKLMADTKLRKRANQAVMALLSMGRAAGYIMVAAIQDPRKEVLTYRDLFPLRVALRLDKGMVDLILKPGSHELGAYCEEILREIEAGMGYVLQEEVSDTPVKVRAHWVSDEMILGAL